MRKKQQPTVGFKVSRFEKNKIISAAKKAGFGKIKPNVSDFLKYIIFNWIKKQKGNDQD